jgi:hypothetical protein
MTPVATQVMWPYWDILLAWGNLRDRYCHKGCDNSTSSADIKIWGKQWLQEMGSTEPFAFTSVEAVQIYIWSPTDTNRISKLTPSILLTDIQSMGIYQIQRKSSAFSTFTHLFLRNLKGPLGTWPILPMAKKAGITFPDLIPCTWRKYRKWITKIIKTQTYLSQKMISSIAENYLTHQCQRLWTCIDERLFPTLILREGFKKPWHWRLWSIRIICSKWRL